MRKAKEKKAIYDNNSDNLPKKMGDMLFNLFVVMAAAIFADILLKGGMSNFAVVGALAAAFVFIFGILMYKKGGL